MVGYYEDFYIENLYKDCGYDKQLEAIKALGKIKSRRAIGKLTEICRNEKSNKNLRLNSISALAEIEDFSFLKFFTPFDKIEDEEILERIIQAVGKLKAEEYTIELEKFVNYYEKNLKIDIIEALDKINSENSIKILIKYYSDNDVEIKEIVRFYLQKSLIFHDVVEKMSDEEILNLITVVPEKIAGSVIEKLIEKTENKKIIKFVIRGIGELGIDNGAELLITLYRKENDKEIRLKTIEALEKIHSITKRDFLIEIFENEEDRDIKTKAVIAAGDLIYDEDIAEIIKKYASDKNEWWMLRKIAIIIFARSNCIEKVDVLIKILENEDDNRVIRSIIQELGDLNSSGAIEVIRKILFSSEQDVDLQKVSILALSKLGDKNVLEYLLQNKEARENLMPESLKSMLNFNDMRVEKILADILYKKREDAAMLEIAINGVAESENELVRKVILNLVIDKEYKREIRAKAVMLLANYPKNESEAAIRKILNDDSEWWLIKKFSLMLCKELNLYGTLDIIVDYAENFDERLNKTAKETAKYFYEKNFLNKTNFSSKENYEAALLYYRLL